MRRLLFCLLLAGSLATALAGEVNQGRIIKVLPFLVDTNGCIARSPSLYDRDAYQAYLLSHPDQRSAIRFDILWKTPDVKDAQLKLRVELRGVGEDNMPRQTTLDESVAPHFFRHWNSLTLGGAAYKNFGQLVAWRATLWSGGEMLGEQKSFLW